MATKRAAPVVESITLRYDLHDLPTAQHRAGLAGLLLQYDSMAERRNAGALPADMELPEVTERTPTSVTIRLTLPALQNLLDDLYSARSVERFAKSWSDKNKEPKRVEFVTVTDQRGKTKEEKRYVYDALEPANLFLQRYTEGAKEPWHKLWRDMVWTILRGPKTRGPYDERAHGLPARIATKTWKELIAHVDGAARGQLELVDLIGADFLGAQAANAERVPFQDRADNAFLLQFWPLTVRVFVPVEINADGKRAQLLNTFLIAIPDPRDLTAFTRAYRAWLAELPTPAEGSRRPDDAIVSLPAEGPLEFLHQFARLAQRQVIRETPSRYLAGVEFFAMSKPGNTAKTLAHGRVPPADRLLSRYEGIRTACKNPLVRACRLLAILQDRPWFDPFANPITSRRWYHFVHCPGKTPPGTYGIAWELDDTFKAIIKDYKQLQENDMPDANNQPDTVDRLIYGLVGAYVKQWACQRAGVDSNADDWWKRTTEERQNICAKVFLELRSRHDDDFVRHFTARFGSVPQWLDADTYAVVAAALMRTHSADTGENRPRTRDDVKTLTLLALSAHSRALKSSNNATADDSDSDSATHPENDG